MATTADRIKVIEDELAALKKQLADEELAKYNARLDYFKTLEKYFEGTCYAGSHFRWSTGRNNTVKLCITPYIGNGSYEGGLYENGPSFKLIVSLLEQLKETSGG